MRWSPEKELALREGLRLGLTQREIAENMGVTKYAVTSKCKRLGLSRRRSGECKHCGGKIEHERKTCPRTVCDACTKARRYAIYLKRREHPDYHARQRAYKRKARASDPERHRAHSRASYYRRGKLLAIAKAESAATGRPVAEILQAWI